MQVPTNICTRNKTQYREGTHGYLVKWNTIPCKDNQQTWKRITMKYKKGKLKSFNNKYVTPCIPIKSFHTKPKGAENTL